MSTTARAWRPNEKAASPAFRFWLSAWRSLLVAASIGPLSVQADGPGAHAPRERPKTPAVNLADEMKAIDAYNAGYASIQRAEHYEALAAAGDGAERAHAQRDIPARTRLH